VTNPARAFRPAPSTIPDDPGCYLFRDDHGRVVYVGKAKSLRSRLANYFGAWHGIAPRTRAMLEAARSVEWIVVDSEVEALHLEYTLIQRHRPRYNVRYRDDKSYPYLVLTTSEDVPRARVQRGKVKAGDRRFGPYAHAYAIRETLDLLLRLFPVRTCSQGVYDRAERTDRACLYFHIDKCAAPCVGRSPTTTTGRSSTGWLPSWTATPSLSYDSWKRPWRPRRRNSSTKPPRACVTSCSTRARHSPASRWRRPVRRTLTSSPSTRTTWKRRSRCSSCAGGASWGARDGRWTRSSPCRHRS
jgi:hypothetical protein